MTKTAKQIEKELELLRKDPKTAESIMKREVEVRIAKFFDEHDLDLNYYDMEMAYHMLISKFALPHLCHGDQLVEKILLLKIDAFSKKFEKSKLYETLNDK